MAAGLFAAMLSASSSGEPGAQAADAGAGKAAAAADAGRPTAPGDAAVGGSAVGSAGAGRAAAGAAAPADDLGQWRFFRSIKLDTSPTGANVKGDVKNFPVPVSLTGKNFDFAAAKSDGSDLRFTKTARGTPLPHAIESWDQAGRSAVVWVKVDVVKGRNRAQSIFMHWGNAEAADVGETKAVFNGKDGFVGVYHLNEEGSSSEGGYKDATGGGRDMTGVNLKPGSRVEGRVGKGVMLDYAQTQWVKLDDPRKKRAFDLTTRATVSIWANARSYRNKGNKVLKTGPGYETMFAKGDNSWRIQKFGTRDWHKPAADLIEMCVEAPPSFDLCVVGKTDMVPGKWFHIVAVHDFPKAKIYVNGQLEKTETFDTNWVSDSHAVGLGNQTQFPDRGRLWDGLLDEARVLSVVKNDDWVKLDYESQREGTKLLVWGKPQSRAPE